MEEKLGIYLFGIIETNESQSFGEVNLAGESRQVYTVSCQDTAMVVAEAPVQIYEPTRRNLKAHQDVVTRVMKQQTIVPMSFGNVLESEQDVAILLEKLQGQLKEIFPKISNKIEVGLKVIGHKEWIEKVAQEQHDLQNARNKVEAKSKEAGYYERIELGEAAKNFMLGMQKQCEQEVFEPLTKIADAAKSNEVIGERMLLNSSFLVDLDKEEEFDRKVNEIFEDWEGKVEFKYTGPWPAYNFIDIKLKAAGAS
ncbi:GvpL/GvpF family gas vesicle protein [Sediminibacillus massiliensis]|uniref:GvpL/GvpF family gas vesicle protein n=1 Tax=Sediminibacillus massiliensis TaxID=1926277 RepID=UPI000988812E|nr:GvpL/GvpF family gas vesicle protein [Sediminibacillus massiliensis]